MFLSSTADTFLFMYRECALGVPLRKESYDRLQPCSLRNLQLPLESQKEGPQNSWISQLPLQRLKLAGLVPLCHIQPQQVLLPNLLVFVSLQPTKKILLVHETTKVESIYTGINASNECLAYNESNAFTSTACDVFSK